jgi:amino acid transporter/nucleotide-binding universal stress UspA family protein
MFNLQRPERPRRLRFRLWGLRIANDGMIVSHFASEAHGRSGRNRGYGSSSATNQTLMENNPPAAEIPAEASATSSEVRLSREMRLVDITMIGVGAMIGAGIFVLTGIAAGVAGPALLLVFFLNGLVTMFAAAAYAELGSAFHSAGGGYLYVKTGLKDPQGFMSGWMSWFAYVVACALYGLGFGAYLKECLPLLGLGDFTLPFFSIEKWMAVVVVVVFCFINYRGASEAGGAGNLITGGKIVLLAIFIAFGVWITVHRPDWRLTFTENPLPNGVGSIFIAMGLTFIAFEGYEIIAQCSEEVRNPERNVPKAIFLSLLIVVPIYLLVAFAALGAVHPEGMPSWQYLGEHKETALVNVAKTFFRGGDVLILIGGLFSTMSALNATIYSSSRVSFAMGRDRNLPAWFGKIHPLRKTPHWSILVSGALSAVMAVALPIEVVASAANIMFLLLFIQVQAALITLRKKRPEMRRGFKVPLVPLVPILGILLQLGLAIFLFFYQPLAWLSAAVWIGLGFGVFYGYSRRRDRAHTQLVAVKEAAQRKDYQILACVGNPHRAETILQAALAVARHYDGELIVLSVVEVGDRDLLAQGLENARRVEGILDRVVSKLKTGDIPVKVVVKISHRISFGIIETALEEQCNLIVMGRARRVGLIERIAATIVDRVVRSAPAQVVVVTAEHWPEEIQTILFAYESGPHSKLTADLVTAFEQGETTNVRAVHVMPRSATTEALKLAEVTLTKELGDRYPRGEKKVAQGTDIVTCLLREARGADLIVIGGTEAGVIEQMLAYAPPLELADRTTTPVITVYEMAADPKRWIV